MARQESDREDILREATALVERAELRIAPRDEAFIVGFRRDGSASLFFNDELVFQFNNRDELRRAHAAGELLKAEAGRLIALRRQRTPDEVQLLRRELTDAEQQTQLRLLDSLLDLLRQGFASGELRVVGQHPPEASLRQRIEGWLEQLPDSIAIADRPNVL